MSSNFLYGVREHRLTRPDGRVVAWTVWGDGSVPLLQVPGTPGCRYGIRADRAAYVERDVMVIGTERPGFGASTRLPGHGFVEHADDLAAVLDAMSLDSVYVSGGSGASPYELALAARHPHRVRAVTIVGGAAPCTDEEAEQMVEGNREGRALALAGDHAGLIAEVAPLRDAILADPLAGLQMAMAEAPPADQELMADPVWQEGLAEELTEALRQGPEGWVDEVLAFERAWPEIDLSAVTASVSWWHAASDANCPITAAQRIVDALPSAQLVRLPDDEGHFAGYRRRDDILDDLLRRGA